MDPTSHILVVDDHREIREPLGRYLDRHGLRVSLAADAADARRKLATSAIDLVVLDVMMPGEDGLALCRELRATSRIPVILLTAMTGETDRIVGLEVGADDYVTKPFNPRELLARVKAVLRRTHELPPTRGEIGARTVCFERWTLDVDRRELVDEQGIGVALSTAEFRLLIAFVERPRVVLSREQLLDLTSGREAVAFDRSIDNQVSRLRRKLEADPRRPVLIKTHWGGGYSFAADVTRR